VTKTSPDFHCSNFLPGSCRPAWVAYELGNLASWTAELDACSRSAHEADIRRAAHLRASIYGHAWSLFEGERRRAADLAFQAHVTEHWSWRQAPYAGYRYILDDLVADDLTRGDNLYGGAVEKLFQREG
jgi:hypothetical protein